MNILYLLILCLSTSLSFITYAEPISCSVITTKILFLKKNEYQLLLQEHDGEQTRSVKNMTLLPGKNTLTAAVLLSKKDWKSNVNHYDLVTSKVTNVEMVTFELNLKANHVYRLVALKRKDKDGKASIFDIKVKSMTPEECFIGGNALVMELPQPLQYRLDLVMKDINIHFQKENLSGNKIVLHKPKRVIEKFGIVISRLPNEGHGINVLAVTPASIAAKIGILAGDVIISINEYNLTELPNDGENKPVDILKDNINKLMLNQDVEIIVNRGAITKKVMAKYQEFLLPAYKIRVEIN